MKKENENEEKIVAFPNSNLKTPSNNKDHLKLGIGLGVFLLLIYMFQGEIFSRKKDPLIESGNEPVTLLDLGFSPFMNNEILPAGKLKFYEKNEKGEWTSEEKSLREFSGKPLIIHLWATFCGPCVKELPLYDVFVTANDKVQNFAVVVGKSDVKDIEKFYEQKGIKNLKIVIDEKNIIPQAYKIQGIPASIFVSSTGKPLGYIMGAVNWEEPAAATAIFKVLGLAQ
jgi:thiol-disulfide isomerase/thioredoxin